MRFLRFSRILLFLAFTLVALVGYAAGRASVVQPPPPGVKTDVTDLQIDMGGIGGDLDFEVSDE